MARATTTKAITPARAATLRERSAKARKKKKAKAKTAVDKLAESRRAANADKLPDGLGDMAAPKTGNGKPKNGANGAKSSPRRQGQLAGFEAKSDTFIDEIAIPLMHKIQVRSTIKDEIAAMRDQLHERMKGKKVKAYKVEDAGLAGTFTAEPGKPRLSIKLKESESSSGEAS